MTIPAPPHFDYGPGYVDARGRWHTDYGCPVIARTDDEGEACVECETVGSAIRATNSGRIRGAVDEINNLLAGGEVEQDGGNIGTSIWRSLRAIASWCHQSQRSAPELQAWLQHAHRDIWLAARDAARRAGGPNWWSDAQQYGARFLIDERQIDKNLLADLRWIRRPSAYGPDVVLDVSRLAVRGRGYETARANGEALGAMTDEIAAGAWAETVVWYGPFNDGPVLGKRAGALREALAGMVAAWDCEHDFVVLRVPAGMSLALESIGTAMSWLVSVESDAPQWVRERLSLRDAVREVEIPGTPEEDEVELTAILSVAAGMGLDEIADRCMGNPLAQSVDREPVRRAWERAALIVRERGDTRESRYEPLVSSAGGTLTPEMAGERSCATRTES